MVSGKFFYLTIIHCSTVQYPTELLSLDYGSKKLTYKLIDRNPVLMWKTCLENEIAWHGLLPIPTLQSPKRLFRSDNYSILLKSKFFKRIFCICEEYKSFVATEIKVFFCFYLWVVIILIQLWYKLSYLLSWIKFDAAW